MGWINSSLNQNAGLHKSIHNSKERSQLRVWYIWLNFFKLRENLLTVKCIDLKRTIQWVLTNVQYSCNKIAIMIQSISITPHTQLTSVRSYIVIAPFSSLILVICVFPPFFLVNFIIYFKKPNFNYYLFSLVCIFSVLLISALYFFSLCPMWFHFC